ncbi:heme peroxidase [Mycena crocata]|nr:heme peroxidase [Mycena crocata]
MRSSALLSFIFVMLLGVHGHPNMKLKREKPDGPPLPTNSRITTVADAVNPLCKPWYAIRDEIMGGIFHGRCGDAARASVRLAFHDAGTFSKTLKATRFLNGTAVPNGGADGSMLVDPLEVLRDENNGLQGIVAALAPLPEKYGVSPGDVLHLAGVLGVMACPGGPAITTYIGRKPPRNIAPDGLLPSALSPVEVLLDRFADMGINMRELVALLGAHSTAKQRFQDPSGLTSAMDSTVNIWDVRWYTETAAATAPPGCFRLASDVAISSHPRTKKEFRGYIGEQEDWGVDYSAAHAKMSILGVNKNTLTDCTEILPPPIDLAKLAKRVGGDKKDPVLDPIKIEAAIKQLRSIWL